MTDSRTVKVGTIHAISRDHNGPRTLGITLDFHANRDKGLCTIAINNWNGQRVGYLGQSLTSQDLRDIASAFMAMSERVDGPNKLDHEGD